MKSDSFKKIKKPQSINFALLKHFLLLAVLLIVFVEVIFFIVVGNIIEARAKERLTHVGREVAVFVGGKNEAAISNFIRSFREEGINVYILSTEGKILLPVADDENEDFCDEIDSIKRRLENVGFGGSVIFSDKNNLKYASRFGNNGGTYLFATYSLKIINGAKNVLLVYFVVLGIVVLLVSLLISFGISQKLSSGINNLSATAVRFSKGDYDVKFANSEYQELADLSDTLNSVRDEVKKSDDFKRELLANVSHDLKTPLTMIKAYASMIREISGDNPEKRDKHLQVIIDEADRLTGLVNDVLSVSKVNSHMDEINFKVFNLTEFLYGIINKFEYLQETQGYNLMVDVGASLYTRADEEKIGQVIYNLLGNAVNYTGEDKTVYITLKPNLSGDRIKLTIKDTGRGIAKDELSDIWDRYYRLKETHSRPVKGTGLGLNIVKVILQSHSFDFGVNSEPGKGSEFWVDFPSVPEEIETQ